jgi:hypothetical protein
MQRIFQVAYMSFETTSTCVHLHSELHDAVPTPTVQLNLAQSLRHTVLFYLISWKGMSPLDKVVRRCW